MFRWKKIEILILFLFSLIFFPKLGYTGIRVSLMWKRYVGKYNLPFTCQPLIFKNYILHATNGDVNDQMDTYDRLYVFDSGGKLVWEFRGRGDINGVVASPDLILITDESGCICALSWDGSLIWKKRVRSLIKSMSLGDLDGDGFSDVVVGSEGGYVYALSGRSGSILWKFSTGKKVWSSPAMGDLDGDGVLDVVVGSDDDFVYAISGKDGSLIWKYRTKGWVISSPALADLNGDGILDVVVGSSDGFVYAISGKDGSLIWKYRTKGHITASPALADLDRDGVPDVVVGSWDGFLYILSGTNGIPLWKFKTRGRINSSPVIGDVDGDGFLEVVVTSLDGYLYVFKVESRAGEVFWSRWHGDAAGTGVYESAVFFARSGFHGTEPVQRYLPVRIVSVRIKDENGDGFFNQGESGEILVKIANYGDKALSNLRLKVSSSVFKRTIFIKYLQPGQVITKKVFFILPMSVRTGKLGIKVWVERGILSSSVVNVALITKSQVAGYTVYQEVPRIKVKTSVKSQKVFVKKESEIKVSETRCVRPNPDYYFFGVVVYHYATLPDLDYVKNDEKLIKILATCYMGVPKENFKLLENPSYAMLKRELRDFVRKIRRKDSTFYFYYSGHGLIDPNGVFYILPSDASIEDEEILKESAIDLNTLKRLLSRARGKKIAFFDACRIKPRWKPAVLIYKPKLSKIAMIFSTKEGQISNSDKDGRFSAFTRALYEMVQAGIVNVDMNDDGYVEINELEKPLIKWIRRISADERQTPDFWGPKDLPVFPVQ